MGVEASLCQLVTTGVLHADPHPGNLLLTPEGRLAYIDFGLLVTVPPEASLVSSCRPLVAEPLVLQTWCCATHILQVLVSSFHRRWPAGASAS
jgi:aminoglycoside phosphotransferase (APT) family kinase protein